ncbi:hypothetical protein ACH4SP_22095 [Streptomyces sp. NPDC021093]|uniref:hypothetical protein n=1 Tax=Streptomyces sp. NPDC021093 TaxID=3365112 RepID=UPI0037905C89
MISEPELVPGPDEGPPPETLVSGGGPSRVDRWRERLGEWRRLPWLWALGGALAASAIWAICLYAAGDAAPEQHGYQLTRKTCAKIQPRAMAARLGRMDATTSWSNLFDDPVLNRADCGFRIASVTEGEPPSRQGYLVNFSVEQHRTTDPGPEFEAVLRLSHGGLEGNRGDDFREKLNRVPGLGDKAYFFTISYGAETLTLAVQHGGVVLKLEAAVNRADGEAREVDTALLKPLMEADMRAAMAALRS